MADDIDIEEHDVLDNPQIKNIFPDLTRIKTEVLHEEDEFPYEDYADYNASVHIKVEPRNVEVADYPQIGSKIILGSKPCSTTIVPKIEPKDNVELHVTDVNNQTDDVDVPDVENENLNAYVSLEDWGPMLNNSPCFCKECLILFDTVNTYDAHKAVAHSLLAVVPSVNRAVKSTAKSSIDGLLLCNHCNNKFPDNSSLIKHLYIVMGQAKVEEKSVIKSVLKVNDKVLYYKCNICTSYFVKPNELKVHVASNHRVNIVNPKMSVFNKNCAFCPFQGKDIASYNYHLSFSHTNISSGILKSGKLINYKCTLCSILFESDTSYYKHKAKVHAHLKYKHLSKKVVIDLKNFYLKPTQMILGSKELAAKVTNEKTPILPFKNHTFLKLKQVPISYLFKCANCNIYFLSSITAKTHVSLCSKTKMKQSLTRCSKCPRHFRDVDISLHEFQHTLSNSFKALTLYHGRVIEIFMYECGLCKVILDSTLFHKHTEECDGTPRGQFCPYCKKAVPKNGFLAHVNKHKKGNHRIIQCVAVNLDHKLNIKVNPLKRERVDDIQQSPIKIQKISENSIPGTSSQQTVLKGQQTNKVSFYYCNHCESITIRKKNIHSSGKCLAIKKRLCTMCGLTINVKNGNHAKLHSSSNFTLHDIELFDYDDKVIPIPMSKFYHCSSCQVRFVAQRRLIRHSCSDIRFKTCNICDIKFDCESFKVHYAFHEVNSRIENRIESKERELPDLLMKYESLQAIWNILYQCGVCSTVTDSYDVAVEHSQDHYCQMESFGVILQNCDICKLAFKSDCYEKHKELHQGAALTRGSFNIIQFNYLNLNSPKWFNMFNSLESKIVHIILSTSMYKDTRSVRMRLLQSGNNGETMYLCERCDRIVHANDVTSHAFDVNVCSNVEYSRHCDICQHKFASEGMFLIHYNPKHIDMKAYRILVFNSEEDQTITSAMRNVEVTQDAPEQNIVTQKKNSQGKHIYYRCVKCSMGLSKLKSVNRHRCVTIKKARGKCPYCHLVFLKRLQNKHIMLHRKVYGLNANKLLIEDFTPKSDDKNAEIIKNKVQSPKKLDKITIKLFTKRLPASLYRCIDCDICFFNKKAMKYHFNNHDKKLKIEACDECSLRFKASAISKHKFNHHKLLKLKREEFNITSSRSRQTDEPNTDTESQDIDIENIAEETANNDVLNYSVPNKTEELNESKTNDRALYKCYLCPVHTTSLTQFQKHLNAHTNNTENEYRPCKHCGLNFPENYCNYHENQHLTTDFDKIPIIKNAIAWCAHCQVYLQNFSAYLSHKFKHKAGLSYIATVGIICSTCKLNIASRNYAKHVEYFHAENKVKLEDFYVIGADKSNLINNATIDVTVDQRENEIEEKVLFKCSECSLLLVDKNNHCHRDKTPPKGVKCEHCRLTITSSQINIHKELHHTQTESNKFVIKTLILIYKCSKCNLCSHDYGTMAFHQKNHSRRGITKMVTHNCDICGCNFSNAQYRRHIEYHNKIDENREEIQVIDCHIDTTDETKNEQVIDEETPNTSKDDRVPSPNTKKYKIKLYKCGDCNVCFLSQGVCYKHVLKHTALDAREFVECKICSLQFSIMIYHKHMKKHHIDDSYNLEDVLIEEYRPNSNGSPEIELYYAGDRVQSQLVSTTSEVSQSNTVASDVIDNNDSVSENGQ